MEEISVHLKWQMTDDSTHRECGILFIHNTHRECGMLFIHNKKELNTDTLQRGSTSNCAKGKKPKPRLRPRGTKVPELLQGWDWQ